jgi:CCR4-NOT transcription complex subunit 7/8
MLKRSGFDFDRHKFHGIPPSLFGEYLMTSGLCLNPSTKWITFNGAVDFAYLLKTLLGQGEPLPPTESAFFDYMDSYFCNYFDIKEMKRDIEYLTGGLNKVAKELNIERIGTTH